MWGIWKHIWIILVLGKLRILLLILLKHELKHTKHEYQLNTKEETKNLTDEQFKYFERNNNKNYQGYFYIIFEIICLSQISHRKVCIVSDLGNIAQ